MMEQKGSSDPPLPRAHVRRQYSEPAEIVNDREQIRRGLGDPPPPPKPSRAHVRRQYSEPAENANVREHVKKYSGDSTPPPILPKSWSRQNSGQNETFNDKKNAFGDPLVPLGILGCVEEKEKLKADLKQVLMNGNPRGHPMLARTAKKQQVGKFVSYKEMTPWRDVLQDLLLRGLSIEEIIVVKAEHLYKGIQEYMQLMSGSGEQLEELINDLKSIADNLDKVSKGTKIAGITGGASTAAGGVAAVAGVILAPFTAGISLAMTAVGVGVAAAGGVTGAAAAIANKANLTQDQKKIQKSLQEFKIGHEKILTCLKFISEGMDQLKYHGLSVLKDMMDKDMLDSKEAASAVQLTIGEGGSMVSEKSASASGLLDGFALGMDMYFTKDGQKVKKGLESKLAMKLRQIANDLEHGFKELNEINDVFKRDL